MDSDGSINGKIATTLIDVLRNSSTIGAYMFDCENGKVFFCNKAFADLLGFDIGEIVDDTLEKIVCSLDRQRIGSLIERLKSGRKEIAEEVLYRTSESGPRSCLSFFHCFSVEGRDAAFVTVLDRAADKAYETFYKSLININQVIIKSENERELLESICAILSDDIHYSLVILCHSKEDESLELLKACGDARILTRVNSGGFDIKEILPAREDEIKRLMKSKNVVVFNLMESGCRHALGGILKENEIRSACYVPLYKTAGDVEYAIFIYSKTPRLFSDKHISLIEQLQSDVCFALEKMEQDRERKLFLETFEKSPAWIVVTDKDGNILRANRTVFETTGYTEEELIGKNPRIFKSGYHSDEFYKRMWETITSGKPFRSFIANKAKDGSIFYLDAMILPVTINGEIYRYINVSREVTKEIKQKERIEKLSRLYKTLSDIENLLLTSSNSREVLKGLPDIVLKNHDFAAAFIVERDEAAGYRITASAAKRSAVSSFLKYVSKKIRENYPPVKYCLFYKAIEKGHVYIENNIDKKEQLGDFSVEFKRHGLLSSFAVPLKMFNKTIGALVGVSTKRNFFDKEMYAMFRRIESIISYSLEKFETDKWHDMLLNAINKGFDTVVIMDKSFHIVYVNETVLKISGYTREELLGKHHSVFSSRLHDRDFARRFYKTLTSGEPFSGIMVYRTKDNRLLKFLVNIIPYRVDGEIAYYISTGRDITKQLELQEALEDVLTHDSLTRLKNRYSLMKTIKNFIDRAKYKNQLAAVAVINPIRLSHVNHAYGFEVGNRVIIEIGNRLKSLVRSYDTVAKLESDKFAVFLEDLKTEEDALVVVMKLISELSKPFLIMGKSINLNFNAGVSLYPQDATDPGELVEKAELALMDAKGKGEGSIGFYREKFREEAEKKITLKSQVHEALSKGEFVLYYQPYVSIDTGRIVGAEALIRWIKNGKVIPPLDFIPYLEEIGLVQKVEEWSIGAVPQTIKRWMGMGLQPVSISLNISPDSFKNRDFVATLLSKIEGIDPSLITVEIIERLLLEDSVYTRDVLHTLRQQGIKVSMDDFGTGYSSLSYLSSLAIDFIKIDISFIRKMLRDKNTRAVVKTIILLSKDLEMKTIAEGVEKMEQLALLREMGCDYAQGFLYSKPLPEEEFVELLKLRYLKPSE